MEIGSIYEINPLDVPAEGRGDVSHVLLREIEKYGKDNVVFTLSGRSAIGLALRSIARNRPGIEKTCLLPAYMCDTVFFPFEQEGWKIDFYHVNKNLEADEEELNRLIEEIRPGLLFIHAYYGKDTWKPMRSLFQGWKAKGICIMEDVTQSYYLEGIGEEADYVVGSLRKWYPLPDGGFAASAEPLEEAEILQKETAEGELARETDLLEILSGRNSAYEPMLFKPEFTEKRIELLTKKWEYLYGDGSPEEKRKMKKDFLRKNREMEDWLDKHSEIDVISGVSAKMLQAVKEEECRNQRNRNYAYLYKSLEGKRNLRPILDDEEGSGTAPLYLAVYALDRDGLQSFLTSQDIYAPVLWPLGKENEGCLTEDEKYIYSHMLALPIDQRYGREDMEQVAEVLDEYEKSTFES